LPAPVLDGVRGLSDKQRGELEEWAVAELVGRGTAPEIEEVLSMSSASVATAVANRTQRRGTVIQILAATALCRPYLHGVTSATAGRDHAIRIVGTFSDAALRLFAAHVTERFGSEAPGYEQRAAGFLFRIRPDGSLHRKRPGTGSRVPPTPMAQQVGTEIDQIKPSGVFEEIGWSPVPRELKNRLTALPEAGKAALAQSLVARLGASGMDAVVADCLQAVRPAEESRSALIARHIRQRDVVTQVLVIAAVARALLRMPREDWRRGLADIVAECSPSSPQLMELLSEYLMGDSGPRKPQYEQRVKQLLGDVAALQAPPLNGPRAASPVPGAPPHAEPERLGFFASLLRSLGLRR
jgi:hypothetical protein